jgi:glutaredoxin-related protein
MRTESLNAGSVEGTGRRFFSEIADARVVVFHSPISDVREIVGLLERRGVSHRTVVLSMASHRDRERFHALQAFTGWQTLPQVFVDGQFIGGEPELRRHPIAIREASRRQERLSADRLQRLLGYGGVLPFLVGLIVVAAAGEGAVRDWASRLTLGYGAVILSFLGAVHWGRLLERGTLQDAPMVAFWSVLPAVVGWATLALPVVWAAPVQVLAFVEVYVMDRQLLRREPAAGGYLRLRARLTGAVASLLLGTWAVTALA